MEGFWIFAGFLVFFLISNAKADDFHRRFEYKYSFKGPYLAQKDGTVPFWEYFGNAIASEEMVRITPSLKSKKGSVWTKSPTTFDWWEAEVVFRVVGRGRLGADGLAFWFTDRKGVEGPVYGSNDQWVGLGLFFDSFDNDNKGNNPYILAMTNDGTKVYDHQSDGSLQMLSGCPRDFRNKAFPVRAKIEYYKNVLTVYFHSGNTNSDQDYELCMRAENVFLPQRGYFGLSAATGGLADDHDALKFLTYSLYPPGTGPATQTIADGEKEKYSKEYEEYKQKLERQKEEYQKQHPDQARQKDMELDPEGEYESQQQKELKQIFQGQGHMFELIKALHRKMDEIIGRQERALSMLSAVQVGGVQGGGGGGGQGGHPQPGIGNVINRHEVEAILANQRDATQTARDLKMFVQEIHQRTGQLGAGGGGGGTGQPVGLSYETQNMFNEMRDGLNVLKKDVSALNSRPQGGGGGVGGCPTPACLSSTIFFVFTGLQIAIILGYMMYKSSKDAQAKKFY